MKIKLNPELTAKVMIALRQEGEDPNNYFEMEVDTGTTLVEGQTRLTEFMQPDETPRLYFDTEAITEVERQKAIDGMRKYVEDGLMREANDQEAEVVRTADTVRSTGRLNL